MLALAAGVQAETIIGRVVKVVDGDTVTVLDSQMVQHKIRLAGIDAPEKTQPFANRSKESLSDLAFEKDRDCRDRKERPIRARSWQGVGGWP